MKKVLTVLSVLFLLNQADSQVTQEWAARYNGPGNSSDFAYSVAVDGSGNVYITGWTTVGAYADYTTIKYNSSGVQQWVANYNGTAGGTDYAYAIAVDGLGNVYVTGGSVGIETNYYDYATVKYDASGVQQWVRRFDPGGGDIASLIAVDGSGNIYVSGYSSGGESADDYLTIKYNSSGSQIWVARYGGVISFGHERPYSLVLDAAGNVYVTGESYSSTIPIRADYATVKYNSDGVQQWASRYNGSGNSYDYAYSVAVGPSGNVCVTGSSEGIGTNADYATVQYSSTGVEQWVRRYNFLTTAVEDVANSVAVDGSGNVYVTGYSARSGTNLDYATIKYNSAGDSLWVKRYNGASNSNDKARDLVLDGSGNVYVTGFTGVGFYSDYTTIKYNSSGAQQWLKSYSALGASSEDARSIALDGLGNVYITGYSSTDTTLWDYATVKYSQTGSSLTLNLTAFIEGFYNSVSNNMISDTARVYLKNNSSPYNTIDSAKGILSSSGAGTFLFSNAVNGVNYYLAVKHRNSIETWSSSGNAFTSGTLTYNFSTNLSQAYGSNEKQVDVSPVRFAIYSGDVNQDGVVDATDAGAIDNDASNFVTGYISTDVTGDAVVDASDAAIADNNASNFVSKITP